MTYQNLLLLMLLPIYLYGCNQTKGLPKSNLSSDEVLRVNVSDSIPQETYGTYYLYKSCWYAKNDKTRCDSEREYSWTPKKIKDDFVVRVIGPDSGGVIYADDFFLVIDSKKSYISFSYTTENDTALGWSLVDSIEKTHQGYKVVRSGITQTFGDLRLDEKAEPTPKNFYPYDTEFIPLRELRTGLTITENKVYGGLIVPEKEVFDLIKSGNEYYIDCANHFKNNSDISSTIVNACADGLLVWLKKIK